MQYGDANVAAFVSGFVMVVNVGVVGDRLDELEYRGLKWVPLTERQCGLEASAFELADVIVCVVRQTKSAWKETQSPFAQMTFSLWKRLEAVASKNHGRVVVMVIRRFPSVDVFQSTLESVKFSAQCIIARISHIDHSTSP
jgi:hypothetical protein